MCNSGTKGAEMAPRESAKFSRFKSDSKKGPSRSIPLRSQLDYHTPLNGKYPLYLLSKTVQCPKHILFSPAYSPSFLSRRSIFYNDCDFPGPRIGAPMSATAILGPLLKSIPYVPSSLQQPVSTECRLA
jgi:hypothetical protein